MVNFWPDIDLDDYINLKSRSRQVMKISVMTATGDDNPIVTTRVISNTEGSIERLQHEVVE
jgi:hypothetical protein